MNSTKSSTGVEIETNTRTQTYLKQLVDAGNNLAINRNAIRIVGADCALLLGELVAQYNLYESKNQLTSDKAFYCTIEHITDLFGWKSDKQQKLFTLLHSSGLIIVTYRDKPAKRYIKINFRELLQLYSLHKTDK